MNNKFFTVEVYQYNERTPYSVYCTRGITPIIEDYACWGDFPTIETFFRVFIANKQKTFEKLYLDDEGGILTRFVFTVKEN